MRKRGWGIAQPAEHLPSMHKALDLIPRPRTWGYTAAIPALKRQRRGKRFKALFRYIWIVKNTQTTSVLQKINLSKSGPQSGRGVLPPGLSLPCGPSRGRCSPSETKGLYPPLMPRPSLKSCRNLDSGCQSSLLSKELNNGRMHRAMEEKKCLFNQMASEGTWFLSV